MCTAQLSEDNLATVFYNKNILARKHSLKAIYLSKNDHSSSVDIVQLQSIRYFRLSKKRVQIWLQFIEGPLCGLSPTGFYISRNRLGRWKTGFACKGETAQECISPPAELTLMKLYWNVPSEARLLLKHSASQWAWKKDAPPPKAYLGVCRGS